MDRILGYSPVFCARRVGQSPLSLRIRIRSAVTVLAHRDENDQNLTASSKEKHPASSPEVHRSTRFVSRARRVQRARGLEPKSVFNVRDFFSTKREPWSSLVGLTAVEHKKGGIVGVIQSCTPVGESDDITLEIDSNNEVFGFLTVQEDAQHALEGVLSTLPAPSDPAPEFRSPRNEPPSASATDGAPSTTLGRQSADSGWPELEVDDDDGDAWMDVDGEVDEAEEGDDDDGGMGDMAAGQKDGMPDIIGGAAPLLVLRDVSVLRQHEAWLRSQGLTLHSDTVGLANEPDEESNDGKHSRHQEGAKSAAVTAVHHTLPLTESNVLGVDLEFGIVVLDVPRRVTDIGRSKVLLEWLGGELQPFLISGGPSIDAVQSAPAMPTRQELERAGRRDILAAIQRSGGFLQVAMLLRLRSRRRPKGYWDDEDALMEEISRFVAANWIELSDAGEGEEKAQKYYYNTVSGQVRFGEPQAPLKLPLDDEGSFIWLEDEEDRVMPSESSVTSAGRYDLHHAILRNGGYRAVAELLDRRPSWPRMSLPRDAGLAVAAIEMVAEENALPQGVMPSIPMLIDAGRTDIAQAILRVGGAQEAAKMLGMATIRNPKGFWSREERVVAAALQFVAEKHGVGTDRLSEDLTLQAAGARAQFDELREMAEEGEWHMPTDKELMDAGRLDLRYALQQSDRERVAAQANLIPRKRGRPRKNKRSTG